MYTNKVLILVGLLILTWAALNSCVHTTLERDKYQEFTESELIEEPEIVRGENGVSKLEYPWDGGIPGVDSGYSKGHLFDRRKILLLPTHPAIYLPSSLVFSATFGKESTSYVFAPIIGINAGVAIPVRYQSPQISIVNGQYIFRPAEGGFYINVLLAAKVSVASLIFPYNPLTLDGGSSELS